MQNNVTELTQRLLRVLDSNYNVSEGAVSGGLRRDRGGVSHGQVDGPCCSRGM